MRSIISFEMFCQRKRQQQDHLQKQLHFTFRIFRSEYLINTKNFLFLVNWSQFIIVKGRCLAQTALVKIIGNNKMIQQIQNTSEKEILLCIRQVSNNKSYQILLLLFIASTFHLFCISTLAPSILFPNPTFQCQGYTELQTQDTACKAIDFCPITEHVSLTSKLSIYCDGRKSDRSLIQSIYGVGNVLGVFINWLADKKGKKRCLQLAIFLGLVYSLLLFFGAIRYDTTMVLLAQFVGGFAYGAFATLSFFLVSRFLTGELEKYVVVFLYLCGTGTAQITIAMLKIYLPGWETFSIIYIIGFGASLILSPLILEEDPVYLFNNNKIQQLESVIERIGINNKTTINNIQQTLNTLSQLNKRNKVNMQSSDELIPNQFKNFKIILLIFLMICCSFMTNTVYFGISYATSSLNLSEYQSLILFGTTQNIGYIAMLLLMPYVEDIGNILIVSIFINTIGCLAFFIDGVAHSTLIQTIVIVIVRTSINAFGCFYVTYYLSNLPKKCQGTAAGIIEGVGTSGKALAPLLVQFSTDAKLSPISAFGVISFFVGFIPLLFLKKTKNHHEVSQNNFMIKKPDDI